MRNLDHRGACGCEENTGDGAGILIQIPDQFFRDECATLGIDLPHIGEYGVGNLFLPKDEKSYKHIQELFSQIALQENMNVLGWRLVPTNAQGADIGATALAAEPSQIQVFVASSAKLQSQDEFERKLFVLRKVFEKEITNQEIDTDLCYFPSLSSRTLIYKGMLTPIQLGDYFPDLDFFDRCSLITIK